MANPVPTPSIAYTALKRSFYRDIGSEANRALLGACFTTSLAFLAELDRVELTSSVPNKEYFAFTRDGKLSRPVNVELFGMEVAEWEAFAGALAGKNFDGFDSARITHLIYSVAMSFCCYIDTTKTGDKKTPGTFFEYLISHLFASRLGVNPSTSVPVLNLDMAANLPTDFVFNLGPEQPKFHLPVKTSTRERVIQVWAHQRVLDGVFGTGRFIGTPVILTETKRDTRTNDVVEICLPEQWRIYQMHIAQLRRIYYLDLPVTYDRLNQVFPPLHVRPFGDFFFEAEALAV